LYELFKDFCNIPPQVRKITGGGAKERFSIWFQTFTHPEFKNYREIFYKNKIDESGNFVLKNEKLVFRKGLCDEAFLEKWLTARAIAYWFINDGSYRKNASNTKIINFSLSTHGFSKEENEFLSNFLNKQYNLNTKVYQDVNHYYININNIDVLNFRLLIKDYIHSDFHYKIFDDSVFIN